MRWRRSRAAGDRPRLRRSSANRLMTWVQRHRLRQFLKDSIWIGPTIGIGVALVLAKFCLAFDNTFEWEHSNLQPEAARTVLITLAGAMFTFVVFVSSALLIALQLASA